MTPGRPTGTPFCRCGWTTREGPTTCSRFPSAITGCATSTPTLRWTGPTSSRRWCGTWPRRCRAPIWSACSIRTSLPAPIPAGTRLVTQDVTLYPLRTVPQRHLAGSARLSGDLGAPGRPPPFSATTTSGRRATSRPAAWRANNHGLFLHGQQTLAGTSIPVRRAAAGALAAPTGVRLAPRGAAGFLLAGEHGPLSSTFLRVSAGRGITEPSLIQNFARESYVVGNPDLRPEKTASYEAGLVQEWFGRRARTEVAVFHNSFRRPDRVRLAARRRSGEAGGTWRRAARAGWSSRHARGWPGRVTLNAVLHAPVDARHPLRLPDQPLLRRRAGTCPRRPGNSGSLSLVRGAAAVVAASRRRPGRGSGRTRTTTSASPATPATRTCTCRRLLPPVRARCRRSSAPTTC